MRNSEFKRNSAPYFNSAPPLVQFSLPIEYQPSATVDFYHQSNRLTSIHSLPLMSYRHLTSAPNLTTQNNSIVHGPNHSKPHTCIEQTRQFQMLRGQMSEDTSQFATLLVQSTHKADPDFKQTLLTEHEYAVPPNYSAASALQKELGKHDKLHGPHSEINSASLKDSVSTPFYRLRYFSKLATLIAWPHF